MTSLLLLSLLLPSPQIERLGHRSFRVREAAYKKLSQMGPSAAPCLLIYSHSPDHEIRRRCDRLLAPYEEEMAERQSRSLLPTRYPKIPWMDFDIDYNSHFLGQARAAYWSKQPKAVDDRNLGIGPPHWPEYRLATRLWVKSQLLQRRPVAEIRETLDALANQEISWIRLNRMNYKPPLELPKGWKE